jgi:carbon dioxide concentrating mechanism protein CcmO
MIVMDTLDKAANVRVLQAELNDLYGVCMKVVGTLADVRSALRAGRFIAETMQVECVVDVIPSPDPRALQAYDAIEEFNPLIEQDVVHLPVNAGSAKEHTLNQTSRFAIGFIETQGFTAVIEAIDTACKTADVQVLGREKLGGGYITVIIKGDVAAVKAAIEAGKEKVNGLGKLIAAHVIPSPSHAVLSLLPKP